MLTILGDLNLRTANIKAAEEAVEEADRLRESVGVPEWDDTGVERTRGEIAMQLDELSRAVEIAEGALERDLSTRGRARMCNLLGLALATAGDFESARRVFEEGAEALTVDGNEEALLSIAHGNIAEAAMRLEQTAVAARHQRASLELALALGQPVTVAYSLIVAARDRGSERRLGERRRAAGARPDHARRHRSSVVRLGRAPERRAVGDGAGAAR